MRDFIEKNANVVVNVFYWVLYLATVFLYSWKNDKPFLYDLLFVVTVVFYGHFSGLRDAQRGRYKEYYK